MRSLQHEVYKRIPDNEKLQDETLVNEQPVAVSYMVVYIRKKAGVSVSLVPLRKNLQTGKIERLVSFDLAVSANARPATEMLGKTTFLLLQEDQAMQCSVSSHRNRRMIFRYSLK